jgi:hypothetical protein
MLEAENEHSSTISSQQSLASQAETLDIDEPCINAVYSCGAVSTIIMEVHPVAASIWSCKEAGADPVAPAKHYDEEITEKESFILATILPAQRNNVSPPPLTRYAPGL